MRTDETPSSQDGWVVNASEVLDLDVVTNHDVEIDVRTFANNAAGAQFGPTWA